MVVIVMLILHHMHEYQTLFNNIKYNSFPFLFLRHTHRKWHFSSYFFAECYHVFPFFFIFILVFCVCALKDILRYDRRTLSRPSEVCKKKKLSIKIMRFTACHCCSSLSLVVIRKKVRKKERKKMRIFYCLEFGSFCWSSCSM